MLGSSELAGKAIDLYRQRFSTLGMYENRVYDGIPEALAALKNQGARLFVATSKPHVYATKILQHFALDTPFETVFGSELDGTRTDKTDLLKYALEITAIPGPRATMIGDRKHDIIGAKNNAMKSVAVLYGYGTRQELEAAGADRILAEPGDVGGLMAG